MVGNAPATMKILKLENGSKSFGVEIRAVMSAFEFEQLAGNLDNLGVFATKTITHPTTFTKTGARHNFAKYLLLPSKLRRKFRLDEFDFNQLRCGTAEIGDSLYLMFQVPKQVHIARPAGATASNSSSV